MTRTPASVNVRVSENPACFIIVHQIISTIMTNSLHLVNLSSVHCKKTTTGSNLMHTVWEEVKWGWCSAEFDPNPIPFSNIKTVGGNRISPIKTLEYEKNPEKSGSCPDTVRLSLILSSKHTRILHSWVTHELLCALTGQKKGEKKKGFQIGYL